MRCPHKEVAEDGLAIRAKRVNGKTSLAVLVSNEDEGGKKMDLDRITHPPRLAKGSHRPGSGKGCAMNVISYINGDDQVTDFPASSARPLSSRSRR